jgi:4a-hydroxytetrahydrobiopterin dehydratase
MNLPETARQSFVQAHPDWELHDESITRTFVFDGFTRAIGFVVELGFLAEAADHHPDIDIRWNKVTLVLSTHSEGALTSKDTELAAAIDEI